jgi:hypothetical protein
MASGWNDAAFNCIWLQRWQDAISYATTALAHGGNSQGILAHAYSHLGQWEEASRYGLQALNMRASEFSGEPVIPLSAPGPLPPPPSEQTRERNIISFSLFGRDSKYCETAVLNVQKQPRIYPHWVCRFYVDVSVPDQIIVRLEGSGAQIMAAEGAATQWPGQMWRFLALNDPLAHRILFRDADSVISRREAGAVEQWISSGKRFHMMRDWGSHTELMLAGMWGVVCGSLPSLEQLMQHFMRAPLESRHFADQFFLRQYVWPYARTSLMQHDSVFGFMGGVAFPEGERPEGFHVGLVESALSFSFKINLPDGSDVTWALFRIEKQDDGQSREELICSYTNAVQNGAVQAHIPERYAQWIKQGTTCVRFVKSSSPA